MPELQLKLAKRTDEGAFGKAINNFNKVIYSSGNGLYGIIINMKRGALLKSFSNCEDTGKIADEEKRNNIIKKYEKAYENYLNTLEKYIQETLYNKVQKKVATLKEDKIMSEYYEVMAIKGSEYVEFKYRRQVMLLNMDFDMVIANKAGSLIEKYKKFYVVTMEKIYKAMMRHLAVLLTDTKVDNDDKYKKIYKLIEDYIKYVLPFCDYLEGKDEILNDYTKYVANIDVYAQVVYSELKKNTLLLELSRRLFLYSLPMIAAEECYIKLLKQARVAISNSFIEADKFELYHLLLDIIESYNVNVLSQKVYWETPTEREEYNKFWGKFQELKKLQRIDLEEYDRNREILFITYDLKMLAKSKKNYEGIKKYYRERMIMIHGFRRLKNNYTNINGRWRTKRKCTSDENIEEVEIDDRG